MGHKFGLNGYAFSFNLQRGQRQAQIHERGGAEGGPAQPLLRGRPEQPVLLQNPAEEDAIPQGRRQAPQRQDLHRLHDALRHQALPHHRRQVRQQEDGHGQLRPQRHRHHELRPLLERHLPPLGQDHHAQLRLQPDQGHLQHHLAPEKGGGSLLDLALLRHQALDHLERQGCGDHLG